MSNSHQKISNCNSGAGPRILLAEYQEEIWPWVQHKLATPFWRFYWDPEPGGVLDLGDGSTVELTPEFFTVIPGYFGFSTRAERPFAQYYIHFSFPEQPVDPPNRLFRFPAEAELCATLRRAFELSDTREALRRSILMHQVLCTVLARLPEECLRLPAARDERVEQAVRRLRRHLDSPPSNPELAHRARMSVNGFIRLFHRECGRSPQEFGRRVRLELACEMLQEGRASIDEIALATGFADRYHFSRAFRRLLQQSPADFRRRNRLGPETLSPRT